MELIFVHNQFGQFGCFATAGIKKLIFTNQFRLFIIVLSLSAFT